MKRKWILFQINNWWDNTNIWQHISYDIYLGWWSQEDLVGTNGQPSCSSVTCRINRLFTKEAYYASICSHPVYLSMLPWCVGNNTASLRDFWSLLFLMIQEKATSTRVNGWRRSWASAWSSRWQRPAWSWQLYAYSSWGKEKGKAIKHLFYRKFIFVPYK